MAGKPASGPSGHSTDVFVEVKPQLRVAQLNLNVRNLEEYELEVHKAGVRISAVDDGLQQNIHLSDVQLLPGTCHSMQWSAPEGLFLRLQIDGNSEQLTTSPADGSSAELSQSDEKHLKVFRASPFTCLCVRCGHPILKNVRFKRVLPLPSGNWQEMTDSWFCHRHDDEHISCDHHENNPLSAKPGDCLVTSDIFMVHHSSLQPVIVDRKRSGAVQCQRCHAQIGQTLDTGGKKNEESFKLTSVQIYRYAITFPTAAPEKLPSWSQHIEWWLMKFILSEVRTHSTCRILLEAAVDDNPPSPVLLLWVLDSKLSLYLGPAKEGETGDVELGPQPVLKVMYRECLQEESKMYDLTVEPVVKNYLYLEAPYLNKSSGFMVKLVAAQNRYGLESRNDFTVHTLNLPKFLCLELLKILVRNSARMPQSQRQTADYKVSFLRCKKQ